MDDASNALLTFLRANLAARGRSVVSLADTEDRVLVGHLLGQQQFAEQRRAR